MRVKIGPLTLKNPVMPASGTFGYGDEYLPLFDPHSLGAIVTKSLSLEPRQGNPPPRLYELQGGLINSVGLQNIGLEAFSKEKLPTLRGMKVPIIVSFFGLNPEEYIRCAERLSTLEGIAALEANLSCPNVRGMIMGSDPKEVLAITQGVKAHCPLPLLVKLPPDPFHIGELALAAQQGGADGLTLVNTLPALVIDLEERKPFLGGGVGGMSGPVLKPVALKIVWEVSQRVKIPIIGVGGIRNWRDALEFILAGATAIQVGTATFSNPYALPQILEGIKVYLKERGIEKIEELRGKLEMKG